MISPVRHGRPSPLDSAIILCKLPSSLRENLNITSNMSVSTDPIERKSINKYMVLFVQKDKLIGL